jgi:rubrerythrin
MLTKKDKLLEQIDVLPFADARDIWIARCMAEKNRFESLESALSASGLERVESIGKITTDGREVVHIGVHAYALRPEVHAARVVQAFEAAKKAQPEPETKSVVGTESLSTMTCPKCGDTLQHTAVCPSCAAGKLGYRHRYTCVCGGVDLISKDKL